MMSSEEEEDSLEGVAAEESVHGRGRVCEMHRHWLRVVVDGESVRRFKKERKVGEGGYAVVYEGRDLQTNRRVAIKKIKMTTHGAGLDISAIREVRVLTELRHPNIVEVRTRALKGDHRRS